MEHELLLIRTSGLAVNDVEVDEVVEDFFGGHTYYRLHDASRNALVSGETSAKVGSSKAQVSSGISGSSSSILLLTLHEQSRHGTDGRAVAICILTRGQQSSVRSLWLLLSRSHC